MSDYLPQGESGTGKRVRRADRHKLEAYGKETEPADRKPVSGEAGSSRPRPVPDRSAPAPGFPEQNGPAPVKPAAGQQAGPAPAKTAAGNQAKAMPTVKEQEQIAGNPSYIMDFIDSNSDKIAYIVFAYVLLGLITLVKALFAPYSRANPASAAAFTFLPPFFEAVQRSLLGPVFYFRELGTTPAIIVSFIANLALMILPVWLWLGAKKIEWKNDPDALRKRNLQIAGWAVMLISCLPLPFGIPYVSGILTSPGVQFSHTLRNFFGSLLEWLYRGGMAVLSVMSIRKLLGIRRSEKKDIMSRLGGLTKGLAKGTTGAAAREILLFWGGTVLGSAAFCTLCYFMIPIGTLVFPFVFSLLEILAVGAMVIWGIAAAQYICDRMQGKLEGCFLFCLAATAVLSLPAILFTDFSHYGSLYRSLERAGSPLFETLKGLMSFMTAVSGKGNSKLEVPSFIFFADYLAVYGVSSFFSFIYCRMIRCPYCGRYGARKSEKARDKLLGERDYTVRTSEVTDIKLDLKRDGWTTDGFDENTFKRGEYKTRENLLGQTFVSGTETVTHTDQDYHEKTWRTRKHTTCIYCGRSLSVKYGEDTETEKTGEARDAGTTERKRAWEVVDKTFRDDN